MPVFSYHKNKPLDLDVAVPADTRRVICGVVQVCTNELCVRVYTGEEEKEDVLFSRKASLDAVVKLHRKRDEHEVSGKQSKEGVWTFDMSDGSTTGTRKYTMKCFVKDCNSNKSFCGLCRRKLSCVVSAKFIGANCESFISPVYFIQSTSSKKRKTTPVKTPKAKKQRSEENVVTRTEFETYKYWMQDVFSKFLPAVYKHRIFARQTQRRLEIIENQLSSRAATALWLPDMCEPLPIEVDELLPDSNLEDSSWEEVERDIEALLCDSQNTSAQTIS